MKRKIAFLLCLLVAANVLMLLAFVLGVIGLTRMNVQFFPTFELDVISVHVVWSGAAAEDVENGWQLAADPQTAGECRALGNRNHQPPALVRLDHDERPAGRGEIADLHHPAHDPPGERRYNL